MNCKKCNNLFIEALYGEIETEQQHAFDAHLAGCEKCTSAFREMQSTLQVMSKRKQVEPDTAYLDRFWAQLAPELQKATGEQKNAGWSWRAVLPKIRLTPKWALGFAGATALLISGILIGKFYFGAPSNHTQFAEGRLYSTSEAKYAEVAQRSDRYLERSKILLLGLVNFEPTEFDSTVLNMRYKKQLSRELVREASVLKDELADTRQRRLQKLVGDIEIILLQIANLEAAQDFPAIEIIRSSVDRKGILFKINLEEMRRQNQIYDSQDSPKKINRPNGVEL
ncbi:MAG: anti-sigma factor family protein [bacterium]